MDIPKPKREKPGKPPNHPPVLNIETGMIFETYTEAAKAIGGSRYGVYKCCVGVQEHHHNYHFKFT